MKLFKNSQNEPTKSFEETLEAALKLSPAEKAMLADRLVQSLDAQDQNEIDKAWAEEVERRIREIDEGTVEMIPGEEVLARLRSRYKG